MSNKIKGGRRKGEKNIFVTILKVIIIVFLFLIQIAGMLLLYTTAHVIYMYARIVYNIAKIATPATISITIIVITKLIKVIPLFFISTLSFFL